MHVDNEFNLDRKSMSTKAHSLCHNIELIMESSVQ